MWLQGDIEELLQGAIWDDLVTKAWFIKKVLTYFSSVPKGRENSYASLQGPEQMGVDQC